MKKSKLFALAAVASLATVGLVGCAAEEETTGGTATSPSDSGSTETALPAGDGKVTIFGGYAEADSEAFQAGLDAFGAENGIEITFTSLASFDTDIKVKIEAGQEPDIALWPQPGGLKDLADYLVPLEDVIDLAGPLGTLVPGWESIATVDGQIYGLPVSANMKSLVFYNPTAFSANGYEVPTTEAELVALEEQIKSDGSGYPWCAGIESGGATGWAFTDWMEQYVLAFHGGDAYAKWVSGELSFESPEVKQAADYVTARLLAEGQVNGGGVAMAADSFGNTAPLFDLGGKAAGQCFMLRQGSFITGFMPDAIQAEIAAGDYSNVNVFPLPMPEGANQAVIGGGDIAAVFDGHVDQDVALVASFIYGDQLAQYMVSNGALSPHKTFDTALYPNALTQIIGEGMANATLFGFDGSDQMPAEVNAEFWLSGTDYVSGRVTWEEAAAKIASAY